MEMASNATNSRCRLCMRFSTTNEYININENDANGLNVAQIIDKYIQIKVVDEDLLPDIVCTDCWTKIESFHYFHEMIITARTDFLTKFLKTEIKEDDNGRADTEEFMIENVFAESLMELDDEKPIIEENFSQSPQTQQNRSTNRTPIEAFICDICEMTFDSKMLIEQHIVGTHVNSAHRFVEDAFENQSVSNNSAGFFGNEGQSNNSIAEVDGDSQQQNVDDVIPNYFDKTCDLCPATLNSLDEAHEHYLKEHKIAKGHVKCCGIKIYQNWRIRDHKSWHLNPNIFRCEICEISFTWKANLRKHNNSKHKNRFACKKCNTSYTCEKMLKNHLDSKHANGDYTCDICEKHYGTKAGLKVHRLNAHDIVDVVEKPLKTIEQIAIPDYFDMSCDECFTMLKSFKHAQSHYIEEHQVANGYVKCCKLKMKFPHQIEEHIKWHQDPNIFRCDLCEISFLSKSKLKRHNERHINESVCDICKKTFTSKYSLIFHRKTHDPKEEKFKCTECGKIFSAEDLLKLHLKTSHIKGKSEICEYCAKQFKFKHLLREHIQKMHSEDPPQPPEKVQCGICGGWYPGKFPLQRHMIMHNAEPVKCELCNTTLANQRSFDYHNRKFHKNGGVNVQCHLCQKTFRNKNDLEDHISAHTNEKKHKCSYCDQAYIWRAEMYKHQKKVHFIQWSADKNKKPGSFNSNAA